MAATAKRLFTPTQLTTSTATYYTAPDNTRCVIKKFTLTNSTGGSVNATVYLVPNGFSAGVNNILLSAVAIAANTCREVTESEGHVMNPGDSIQAFDSAGASIDIMVSGVEIT